MIARIPPMEARVEYSLWFIGPNLGQPGRLSSFHLDPGASSASRAAASRSRRAPASHPQASVDDYV
jgi:hypothetical protein